MCDLAAHGLAFGLALFAAGKFLRTMFVLPNWAWDTPVTELGGTFATWAYFGSSAGYSTALGLLELVGAILVVVRRTRLLALAMVVPMLLNIVTIDLFYDVRPGLYVALAMLAVATFLAACDWRRIRDVGRLVLASGAARDRRRGRLRAVAAVATIAGGLLALVPAMTDNAAAKRDVDGIWIVDDMRIAGERPALPWRAVYFELSPRCAIRIRGDLVWCRFARAGRQIEIDLAPAAAGVGKVKGIVIRPSPDHLVIEGTADGLDLRLDLTRKPTPTAGRGW